MTFNIRKIQQHDLDEVVELVNVAYRMQSARAWTTEHAFVEGQRISKNQLKKMLQESYLSCLSVSLSRTSQLRVLD